CLFQYSSPALESIQVILKYMKTTYDIPNIEQFLAILFLDLDNLIQSMKFGMSDENIQILVQLITSIPNDYGASFILCTKESSRFLQSVSYLTLSVFSMEDPGDLVFEMMRFWGSLADFLSYQYQHSYFTGNLEIIEEILWDVYSGFHEICCKRLINSTTANN